MIVKYIAYDGTEFGTQIECLNYEKKKYMDREISQIIFLNENFRFSGETIDDTKYIYIPSSKVKNYIFGEYCLALSHQGESGWYMLNYDTDIFEPIKEKQEEIEHNLKELLLISNILKKIRE